MKRITLMVAAVSVLVGMSAYGQSGPPDIIKDSTGVDADTSAAVTPCEDITFTVYYFHGNKRCMTCRKIEALARQSIEEGFADDLADSVLTWRVVNFEDDENASFAKAYKLFTQTLIVSRQIDGKEAGWINLDQIWQLVHDEDDFLAYVHDEVMAFMQAELE